MALKCGLARKRICWMTVTTMLMCATSQSSLQSPLLDPVTGFGVTAIDGSTMKPDGGGGACVLHPLNRPLSQYAYPNSSVEFHGLSSWGVKEFGARFPEINVTLLDHSDENKYKDAVPFLVKYSYGPDVMTWWPGPNTMRLKEHLLDLKPLLEEHGMMDVLDPFAYKPCQDREGRIYCVSAGIYPWWFLTYRSVLQSSSLAAPRTFEDLLAACHTLRNSGMIPIGLAGKTEWHISAFFDLMSMRTNGADFHTELCEGRVPYTDQRVRGVFEKWQQLIDARCFPDNPLQYGLWDEDFVELIKSKKIAMIFMADWYRTWPWNIHGNTSDIDAFPFPKITPGVQNGNMFPGDAFIARGSSIQTGPIGSLLAAHLLNRSKPATDDRYVRMSPRKDVHEFDGRFFRKARKMLSESDVMWTAFDLVVPPPFFNAIKSPLLHWVNGSMSIDAMLKLVEEQRRMHYEYQNVPPDAYPPSGSYQNSLAVSLQLPDSVATEAGEPVGIRFSINDDDVTELYKEPVQLGPGNWVLRVQAFGGKLADSPVTTIRYHVKDVKPFDINELLDVFLPVLAALVVLCCLCLFVRHYCRMRIARRKLEEEREERMESNLIQGLETAASLGHPMVLISASDFLSIPASELRMYHEGLRDRGKLFVLDTMCQVEKFRSQGKRIVFFSYQWLSWCRLGPDDLQLQAMRDSVSKLLAMINSAADDLFIWLDIVSIPQSNPFLKKLAVDSLYVYAAAADFFVIIAPESVHVDLGLKADSSTYIQRTWTRAEQVFHATAKGFDTMWLSTGGGELMPINESWVSCAVCVFEGEMTCCRKKHPNGKPCDRFSLVPAMLGLFYDTYKQVMTNMADDTVLAIWNHIGDNLEKVFPPNICVKTEHGECKLELFGDMIARVRELVEKEKVGKRQDVQDEVRSVALCQFDEKVERELVERRLAVQKISTNSVTYASSRGAISTDSVTYASSRDAILELI